MNPHIRSLDAAFFKWAFFDFYSANWHPLTWMTHALDYAFWGLNPLGHHLTSIILHSVNTLLVVLFAVRLLDALSARTLRTGLSPFLNERTILLVAGVTGLLFGLHPVHVESVAWVAERKDLLCALFFLLSIIMYMKYAGIEKDETKTLHWTAPFFNRHYLYAVVFFVLALLSKPMAVTLPVILLILDWCPFERIQSLKTLGSVIVEKLPFIAFSLVSSILTLLAQQSGGAMAMMSLVPLSKRIPVAVSSFVTYLWKMIWPLDLVPYYPYPKDISIISIKFMAPIAFVIVITIICVAIAKKENFWLSAWAYYVVTLIPVLGLVQVGGQSMADRYTYLPSIGPFLVMGLAVAWVSGKVNVLAQRHLIVKIGFPLVVLFVFISLSYLTFKQISIWKDDLALWTYVIEKEPEPVLLAYSSRSMLYFERGRFDKAIADFTMVIALDPNSYPGYLYRGMAYHKMGRLDEAIDDYDRAIALEPSSADAYINRSMALDDNGQLDKAIGDCDKAIALDPSNYTAYNNKGALYGKAGMSDRATEAFSKAIAIAPDRAESYYNRGVAYVSLRQYDRALEDFSKTIELNQNDTAAYVSRGRLYIRTGKKNLAVSDFRKACELGNNDGCNALH
jgi:Tfp pilus assembly protein PilF